MKKTTLFTGMMLCLGMLPNSYAATQGKVIFKGEVIAAKLCTVKAGTENQTVDLGYILSSQFSAANQAVGTGKGFTLSVTDCGNATNRLKYYFVSSYAEQGTGILKNSDTTSGNRNSVGIQLFNKNNTAIKVLSQPALPEHNRIAGGYTGTELSARVNGNAVDIDLTARFYGRTVGSTDKAGKVSSEMTFGVWYE
ncbi:MAG: type 1 fimbrial protein [Haemophilus parahaemolyticus]|uniref:fimbrial protein n=1 Tax=Haemophilus parahaemolyticus TaxID=735 RepID=UPI0026EAAC6C|nr:fimbrial protein [Haemophilus parahaemolyticus]MBS6009607.1 type 1 fimbrial protein [Haemophilus parahaemolyticus]